MKFIWLLVKYQEQSSFKKIFYMISIKYKKMCNDYKNLNLINLSKADIIKLIILYNINEEELTNEEQNTIKKLLIKSKENNLYN